MTAAAPAYVDTSVLVKRYVREDGGAAARALFRKHQVLTTSVAAVELKSTLARRHAIGELATTDLSAILGRLARDRDHWLLVEATTAVLDLAEELVFSHAVRSLDAIHLASALIVTRSSRLKLPFATADRRQKDAATLLFRDVVWIA